MEVKAKSSYKDLKVYGKSYEAAKRVYIRTRGFPEEEKYALKDQMRRAATSIPLTIAEGYGKGEGKKELSRFLRMARGSSTEMEVLLDFAHDFVYITQEEWEQEKAAYEEIGKMLSGLINSLKD